MRISAFLITLGILLLASSAGYAQTQGNLPGPLDGNTGFDSNAACSHTANCINLPENVQIGNEIVGCVSWGTTGSAPSSITDSLGNTATQESPVTFGSTGNDRPFHLQMYHFNSAFAGSDYIIITGGSDMYAKNVGRFTGVSDTQDGSLTTNTGTPATPGGSITNSVTSAVNGDIAISCMGNTQGGSSVLTVGNSGMVASDHNTPANVQLGYQNLGLLGNYSITASIVNTNGSDSVAIATALFKPSTTIFLSDTALPQAADSVAYSAQLHVVGGTSATLTYACSGLPSNGLSLNTSTGVISGATPTGATTLSLGCTVTDGTHTSATDTLSLQIGAAFGAISTGSFVSGGIGGGGGSMPALPVSCGDVVLLCTTQGDDTHGSSGWIQALNGSLNKYSDSLHSTVQRFPVFGGTQNGPTSCVMFGPVTTTGSDIITIVNNQSAATSLYGWALDIRDAQGLLDVGNYVNGITSSTNPTASVSYTTPVANELAVAVSTIACVTAGCSFNSTNVSFGAPFSLSYQSGSGSYAMSGFATDAAGSAGSLTATATFNGVTPTNGMNDSSMLVALRPALPFTACVAPALQGEKIRRRDY